MSQRNVIEEVEARMEYVPRRRLILGLILLIPPISMLGMGFWGYELYKAGKRLRERSAERQRAVHRFGHRRIEESIPRSVGIVGERGRP